MLLRIGVMLVLSLAATPLRAADGPGEWWRVSAQLGGSTDFTPLGTQPGLLHDLLPANNCSGCHGGNPGTPQHGFRPFPTWAGSMMANAMRDPLFWAALDVANHDVPGVGDYCLRCHTPRGWYGGRVVKRGSSQPDNDVTMGASGCLLAGGYDHTDGVDNDFGGLPCEFCHRIVSQGPQGQPAMIGNANIWLDDESCDGAGGQVCRHGPYDYPVEGPSPPHVWVHDTFQSDSAVCGSCHDVSSPETGSGPLRTLILANGTDTGHAFPIERTYSEWLNSSYADTGNPQAATCQSCHMPSSQDPMATACSLFGFPNRTGNLPVHAFAGGNSWIPGVVSGEFSDTSDVPGAFGGIGREESFLQTAQWAREMLASAASIEASVEAYTAPTGTAAGSLEAEVKITNLSGHKLPSGYSEGRRMWLNLEVRDANGALVYQSAAYDEASAVLTEDPEAMVFEVLQGIHDPVSGDCQTVDDQGRPMFHFVLGNCIAKDNRIPPLGFSPATPADPNGYDLRPVGASYPETSPGSGVLVNYALADYSVSLPAGSALPVTVFARLYYQTSSREYIEFLRNFAVENGFPSENDLCAPARQEPFVVGPQHRSRGEYMYQLWNGPVAGERIFADGFDGVGPQPGYGKSPPELMALDFVSPAN